MGTSHKVHTSRNHRCRVNKCADRRRALHSIGKPHVQRQLCRFGGAGQKEQQADNGDSCCSHTSTRHLVEDAYKAAAIRKVVECPVMLEDKEDSYHQAEVTDDIDNQGLLCRRNSRAPLIPEAYQQERSQANQSPTHEQEKKVVRAYQQHHRKNKKVKEGEVAPETRVVFQDRKSTRLLQSPDHLVCRLLLEKKKNEEMNHFWITVAFTESQVLAHADPQDGS